MMVRTLERVENDVFFPMKQNSVDDVFYTLSHCNMVYELNITSVLFLSLGNQISVRTHLAAHAL